MRVSIDFSILDNIASPIFVLEVSPTGQPIYVGCNATGCEMAGRPPSDFLGRTALEIYGNDLGRIAYKRHCAVVASKSVAIYELELPLGGKIRTLRTTLTPQLDDTGDVRYIYGSCIDISAVKDAREAKVSLETITSEMEQFVTMAAHDLRAPMRNVSLLAEMLRDGFVDHGDGKLEMLDMMEDVAAKSMTLISDVLAYARATAPEDQHTTFELQTLCRDICDVLDPQGHHKIRVGKLKLTADRTALQIALRNIIDNAIKHGKRAHLDMEVVVSQGEAGFFEVTFSDSGVGFDKHALKFLNGGSFKVDSGYGLLGVLRMIQARGGKIVAENGANGGGLVQFSLPGICPQQKTSTEDVLRRGTFPDVAA